jgi:hypothetical protein
MEPRGLWPWEIVVICGVLVAGAYALGSTSQSEDKPPIQAELKRDAATDEELEQLRRELENERLKTAVQLHEQTMKFQTAEAGWSWERQSLQDRQDDVHEKLRDANANLQIEENARKSLDEQLQDSKDQLRDLKEDYADLSRRFEEEMSSLRASMKSENDDNPSPRVQAYPMGHSGMPTPREARVEEWRRRFQRGQEARDAYNAWLQEEREGDFLSATSRIDIENGGNVDWPEPLLGPAFAPYRRQIELAVKTGDLEMLNAAADGALVLLENRAKQFGRSLEGYIAAKRFLTVVKSLSL